MDYNNIMRQAKAEMDKLITQLPPEQQADFNRYKNQMSELIPDLNDITSDSFDYHKMKVDLKKRRKQLDKLNKEMLEKYGNTSKK